MTTQPTKHYKPVKNYKILLTAGGTGGHFFPALAAAEALQKKGFIVHFSTDKRCMKYIPKNHSNNTKATDNINNTSNINFKIIDLYIRTGSKLAIILTPLKIAIACLKALIYVTRLRPNIVIGFGGYPSFPVLLACKTLSVPIILHEQNRFLGKVNRFFARFAKVVAFSYEDNSLKENTVAERNKSTNTISNSEYIGEIVRDDIKQIRLSNDFTHNPIRILVFGGSQGAKILSQAIPNAMCAIKTTHPDFDCIITHQVPTRDQHDVIDQYKELGFNYHVSDFFHNINELYQNTDLVIARSGASTIAELSAIGLPAIFIPLPFAAENHQYENAKYIEQIGGGWTIQEDDELIPTLTSKIIQLNKDRSALQKAAKCIKSRKSDGTSALVATVQRIID